jgi:hypothetical protein
MNFWYEVYVFIEFIAANMSTWTPEVFMDFAFFLGENYPLSLCCGKIINLHRQRKF